jgi:hypothetical protein
MIARGVVARGVVALLLVVLVTTSTTSCSSPFDDAACTLELRSYPITIARDVPFAFAETTKLKVEVCATREGQSPTCAVVAPVAKDANSYTLGSVTDSMEGTLTKNGNTIKLALTAHVGEGDPSTTTIIRVRVFDDADKDVVKAEGPVRWSDASCHPTPDVTSI